MPRSTPGLAVLWGDVITEAIRVAMLFPRKAFSTHRAIRGENKES